MYCFEHQLTEAMTSRLSYFLRSAVELIHALTVDASSSSYFLYARARARVCVVCVGVCVCVCVCVCVQCTVFMFYHPLTPISTYIIHITADHGKTIIASVSSVVL